jgi:hypothetical protein
LRAFCLFVVVENKIVSSSRSYHTTEFCGPPSGFSVATAAKFLPSRISDFASFEDADEG